MAQEVHEVRKLELLLLQVRVQPPMLGLHWPMTATLRNSSSLVNQVL